MTSFFPSSPSSSPSSSKPCKVYWKAWRILLHVSLCVHMCACVYVILRSKGNCPMLKCCLLSASFRTVPLGSLPWLTNYWGVIYTHVPLFFSSSLPSLCSKPARSLEVGTVSYIWYHPPMSTTVQGLQRVFKNVSLLSLALQGLQNYKC